MRSVFHPQALSEYFEALLLSLKITNCVKKPIARGIIVITGIVYFIMEICLKKIILSIFRL